MPVKLSVRNVNAVAKGKFSGEVLINPPADRLGTRHALLWGRGCRHYVAGFRGPLSIKSVMRGRATWETDGRRYDLDPFSWVVINQDQPYTVSVEGDEPVETFCIFFRRGAVEEIGRVLTTSDATLLDHPDAAPEPALLFPTFRARDALLIDPLRRVHSMLSRGTPPGPWLE